MIVNLTDKITINTHYLIGIVVSEVQESENPYHVIALISGYGNLTLQQFDTEARAIAYKMNAEEELFSDIAEEDMIVYSDEFVRCVECENWKVPEDMTYAAEGYPCKSCKQS